MDSARIAALLVPFLGDAALTAAQLAQLAAYLDLLLRWNTRMNLTAVRDPDNIVTRHFGESLFAARRLYPPGCKLATGNRKLEAGKKPEAGNWKLETGNWKLLDLGSGAGFPGLPIKIWAPAIHVTLLESNQRKATFLREVARALQLADVQVLAERAESCADQIANYKLQITNLTVTLRAVEHFDTALPTAIRLLENFPAAMRRLALLIGSAQVSAARQLAPALAWSEPLPVPQSSSRVLLIGHLN